MACVPPWPFVAEAGRMGMGQSLLPFLLVHKVGFNTWQCPSFSSWVCYLVKEKPHFLRLNPPTTSCTECCGLQLQIMGNVVNQELTCLHLQLRGSTGGFCHQIPKCTSPLAYGGALIHPPCMKGRISYSSSSGILIRQTVHWASWALI